MTALSRRHGWALALMATFTMAVSYLDRQVLAILAPLVTADLRIDDAQYGMLASAFSAAYLFGAPLAGKMLDRVGVRRGMMIAVLAWSFVAAAHCVAQSFAMIFALRLLLGIAESPSFPGGAQTVHRAIATAEQPRAMGVLFTGSSLGAMIAPVIASTFAQRWGWRSAFIGTALVGLIWVPLWLLIAGREPARSVLDARAKPNEHAQHAGFAALLRLPAVARTVVLVLGVAPVMGFLLLWASKLLVDGAHVPVDRVARYLIVPPIMFDFGSIAFGDIASRLRARNASPHLTGALALAAASMCATIGVLALAPLTPWTVTLIAGVAMAGGGGLFAIANANMMAAVPQDCVARAGGLTAAAQSLAYIVANPLIGISVKQTHSYAAACAVLSLCVMPAFLFWLRGQAASSISSGSAA